MVVSWICKKQSSVAVSQVAAELWGIGQLLSEVGLKMKIPYKLSDPPKNKKLKVAYCKSGLMRADILMKALSTLRPLASGAHHAHDTTGPFELPANR
ncbi:hypothetical protein PHYSODRAFT_325249 [Phytophthora sojae]|uniref:Uncharacterized protein n=1 Tax=Phytophthora sojae (strain P6497) TaxID=1094619 RepID=G4YRQ1_PHYSP|nr:hypothetical protein PHYSODRAFT_325249 [Phytophthora sojae]EGZ24092.1 hypothetical protein PHYSODRAFT_325249 [Phytophthora sojae]|eukprot:XP_009519380.1 hypothetical protein PHYSODRAFT_325249 [Phytophthora sojae]